MHEAIWRSHNRTMAIIAAAFIAYGVTSAIALLLPHVTVGRTLAIDIPAGVLAIGAMVAATRWHAITCRKITRRYLP